MGYYVRKSLKAGPFRFNISKSGVGVSAGVPGFRAGTGPRGNYVHVGAHGVYYRSSLGHKQRPHAQQRPAPVGTFVLREEVEMHDITGATALELEPASSDDVIGQLNDAAGVRAWWPVLLFLPVVGWLAAPWVRLRQHARRSVVVFFQVDDSHDEWFGRLTAAWGQFGGAAAIWRIIETGAINTTYQRKVNSGAGALVSRVPASVTLIGPANLVTNIQVPTIEAGAHGLYFLPDRVLVRSGRRFSDVAYNALSASAATTRFIEAGRVPRDSQQVGTTWKYANVKGGPDRRFKNNRQLPILQYAKVELGSTSGLRWILNASNLQSASSAIQTLGQAKTPAVLDAPTT
jgi:hypothetical protein